MNSPLSKLAFLTVAVVAFLFPSCGKKWKEPVTTLFSFRLEEVPENSQLLFYQSSLTLEKLEIEGNRKQGEEHIFLERTTAAGLYYFSLTSESSTISMDIPQGTYSEIKTRVFLNSDSDGSIQLNGAYINTLGDTTPIIFTYDPETVLELRASASGQSSINLVEDNIYHGRIFFNVAYLFDAVPNQDLEDAYLTMVNNIPTIEIDEDNNSDIYDILSQRMDQCLRLTIE